MTKEVTRPEEEPRISQQQIEQCIEWALANGDGSFAGAYAALLTAASVAGNLLNREGTTRVQDLLSLMEGADIIADNLVERYGLKANGDALDAARQDELDKGVEPDAV